MRPGRERTNATPRARGPWYTAGRMRAPSACAAMRASDPVLGSFLASSGEAWRARRRRPPPPRHPALPAAGRARRRATTATPTAPRDRRRRQPRPSGRSCSGWSWAALVDRSRRATRSQWRRRRRPRSSTPPAASTRTSPSRSRRCVAGGAGPRARLALAGAYYEAFQSGTRERPAPNGGTSARWRPVLRAAHRAPRQRRSGGRRRLPLFVFKPDRRLRLQRPDRRRRPALADATEERRRLGGARRRRLRAPRVSPAPRSSSNCPRRRAALRRARRGASTTSCWPPRCPARAACFGAGYALHYNRSNSFGETVMRHFAIARFAAPLPLGLYLAARADLLFAFYSEGPRRADRRHGRPRRKAVRQHRGREPLQRARRPVARLRRTRCAPSPATPSTPTSWAAASSPTAATRSCSRSPFFGEMNKPVAAPPRQRAFGEG